MVAAPTFGLPEYIGGVAQLGLPLLLDPRLVFYPLRAHAARLHGRGRGVHALDDGALRGAGAGRRAPDHVRDRRPAGGERGVAGPPRGLHGLASGPHRQRRPHPPPARHLRRADGLGVPVRQVRFADRARRVDEHRPAGRLGVRALAGERREHLGGARRAPGVPLLAGDVLGGDRSGHPPREQALVPGSVVSLVRRTRHHLPRHLRALLGPGAPRLRPAPGRDHVRRRSAAHAPGAFRVATDPRWIDPFAASSRSW